jgi:hypothetical protein
MPRVRFDGRGRLVAFGHELTHNQTAEMSDEEAAQLAANPHVQVTVLGVTLHGGPATATTNRTHDEEE